MKHIFLSVAFLFSMNAFSSQVQTVPFVNLNLYLGSWHEIASIPQFFQRNCVKNTVATYSLDSQGGIDVLNTCLNQQGSTISAQGKAKVHNEKTNAELSVTFLNLGTWIYFIPGNYWIIDIASDYRYAVVGDANARYGWILSRTPRMSESDLVSAMNALRRNGYDLCQFNLSPQDGGTSVKMNLCDIAPSLGFKL